MAYPSQIIYPPAPDFRCPNDIPLGILFGNPCHCSSSTSSSSSCCWWCFALATWCGQINLGFCLVVKPFVSLAPLNMTTLMNCGTLKRPLCGGGVLLIPPIFFEYFFCIWACTADYAVVNPQQEKTLLIREVDQMTEV